MGRLFMDERFQNFLAQKKAFERLPTLPHILIRLVEICGDDNISLQELSRVLATDAGLTSRVLHLANSSYYRNHEKITHIDQALLRMGRNTFKNIVFSAAVHQVFSSNHGHSATHLKRFWRHSLLSAILARMIATKTGYGEPGQAFFAGMIHDIGRLVLSANFPDLYAQVLDNPSSAHEPEHVLEEERKIGAPHTEVGAWLLSNWNLDSLTVDAVLYHHEPAGRIATAFPLVKIVYAANILSINTESRGERYLEVMSFFSFSSDETSELIVKAEEELETMAHSLGIDIGTKDHLPPREDDDGETCRELMHDVEDMAMLFGTLKNLTEAADEEGMLQAVHEGLRVLFDAPEVLLFLYDKDRQALVNYGDPCSESLTLNMEHKEGIPLRCLREGLILSSLDQEKGVRAIMDEQLARRLGKKGLICAPLIARGEKIGVVAVGLDEEEVVCVKKDLPLLKLFTNVAAAALHADHLKRDYARKIQSERMAAVTALTRRIAHEINNPLGIIKNFLQIIASKLGDNNGVQKEIQIIREEIDRITRILPELSDAEKAKVRVKTPVNLNTVISSIAKMIGSAAGAQREINFHLQLEPDLPKTIIDEDGMKQILINLLKNAVEAMDQGGNVYIETSITMTGKGNIAGEQESDRRKIRIMIRDDGPGIAPAVQAKLFEPCVSTKGKGHSGLGLSVVYQIMRDQGGNVTCDSTPGKGTTFILTLPIRSQGGKLF
jgi:HD-like signal output (HDOD) protein/nitrogen-specific signal transduction histidine kinase